MMTTVSITYEYHTIILSDARLNPKANLIDKVIVCNLNTRKPILCVIQLTTMTSHLGIAKARQNMYIRNRRVT